MFSGAYDRISRAISHQGQFLFSFLHGEKLFLKTRNCMHRDIRANPLINNEILTRGSLESSGGTILEAKLHPFSLVADVHAILADRLQRKIVAAVPKLASDAELFYKIWMKGNRLQPTVLLLMTLALDVPTSFPTSNSNNVGALKLDYPSEGLSITEVAEMMNIYHILRHNTLDDANTRYNTSSSNFVIGTKLSVLVGDFLLSNSFMILASLKNTEVWLSISSCVSNITIQLDQHSHSTPKIVIPFKFSITEYEHLFVWFFVDKIVVQSLILKEVEHFVIGETMKMTYSSEQLYCIENYMKRTYYKRVSLMASCCKAIALLARKNLELTSMAYDYGKYLGYAYQLLEDVADITGKSTSSGNHPSSNIRHGIHGAPMLFAIEEFPQLRAVLDRGLKNPSDVDIATRLLRNSQGIQKTKELAAKYANLALATIETLPRSDEHACEQSRQALVDLAQRAILRTN